MPSEMGLAELYEKEYVAKATGQGGSDQEIQEELNKEHQEIASLFAVLNYKLDALSNFHFTPKPQIEELRVIFQYWSFLLSKILALGNYQHPSYCDGRGNTDGS